jgi:hypothetical protein
MQTVTHRLDSLLNNLSQNLEKLGLHFLILEGVAMIRYVNSIVSDMLLLVCSNLLDYYPSNTCVITASLIRVVRMVKVLPEYIRMYTINVFVVDAKL